MSGARLHTAYRLLLTLGGAAVLGALPWGTFGQDLGALLQPGGPAAPGGTGGGGQGLALAVLLLVATASATLTINYPGRSDVVLLPLPLALAWWALGAPAATLLAGVATLLGNALRRRPPLAVAAGAGRLTLATAGALALAERLFPPAGPQPALSAQVAGGMAVFFVVFSLLDAVLDWLDGRPAGLARTDPLTNLALLPLALFLTGAGERLGQEFAAGPPRRAGGRVVDRPRHRQSAHPARSPAAPAPGGGGGAGAAGHPLRAVRRGDLYRRRQPAHQQPQPGHGGAPGTASGRGPGAALRGRLPLPRPRRTAPLPRALPPPARRAGRAAGDRGGAVPPPGAFRPRGRTRRPARYPTPGRSTSCSPTPPPESRDAPSGWGSGSPATSPLRRKRSASGRTSSPWSPTSYAAP